MNGTFPHKDKNTRRNVHTYKKKAVKPRPIPQMSMGGVWVEPKKKNIGMISKKKTNAVMNLHSKHSKTKNKNAQVVFKCQRNPQMTRNKGEQFKTGKLKKAETIPGLKE